MFGKGLFVSIKGHFSLTKGHLANAEGQVEIKSTSSEVIFDTIDSNLKKNQKGHSLTKHLISGRLIFRKRSLIDKKFGIPLCFIISNSDSNKFEFSYLTKLLSAFKVMPSLEVFHSHLSDEVVPGWS